jgi:yjeF N-terminal region
MLKLYDDDAAKRADSHSVSDYSFTPLMLQESAAALIYHRLSAILKKNERLLIVAGRGNNGADGIAVARMLYLEGYRVSILYISEEKGTAEYEKQKEIALRLGIPFTTDPSADCYLDAMVGVGLKGTLSGRSAELSGYLNAAGKPVYAVDVPSGIGFESDGTGAVKADVTFSLGCLKLSLFAPSSRAMCGRIELLTPLFPPAFEKETALLFDENDMILPPIESTEYKKTRGDLFIAGGAPGFAGAVLLASASAFATGIGLVTVYTDPSLVDSLVNENPSMMVRPFSSLKPDSRAVMLIGPGLGSKSDEAVLPFLLSDNRKVIDADGIRAFARLYKEGRISAVENAVFTPHPGELASLLKAVLDRDVPSVVSEYFAALKELSHKLSATIVVKASVAILVNGEDISVVDLVNPSLAVAGSGDVLGAMIATLLVKCKEAPLMGVLFHKAAGKEAHRTLGFYSSKQLIECAGRLR